MSTFWARCVSNTFRTLQQTGIFFFFGSLYSLKNSPVSSFSSYRTKRRAVAALAAGAAGAAAAYCVYTWYYTDPNPDRGSQIARVEDEEIDKGQPSSSTVPLVLLDPTGGGPRMAQMDAEAHLHHHFKSIQEIAEATTLPSLLPALGRALAAADDLDSSLDRLRQAKVGGVALDPKEKLSLWCKLSVDALARLVSACWMLPLLCLQVRVQLNILGRHLYLETALFDQPGTSSSSGPPPQSKTNHHFLSSPSQEAFLANSEHLAKVGHVGILRDAHAAAAAALRDVPLSKELDSDSLSQLLSDALAGFVESASGPGWASFLLPSPSELREALRLRHPDDRAMMLGSEKHLVDTDAVEAMVREVGGIIASQRFHDVALVRRSLFCLSVLLHSTITSLVHTYRYK